MLSRVQLRSRSTRCPRVVRKSVLITCEVVEIYHFPKRFLWQLLYRRAVGSCSWPGHVYVVPKTCRPHIPAASNAFQCHKGGRKAGRVSRGPIIWGGTDHCTQGKCGDSACNDIGSHFSCPFGKSSDQHPSSGGMPKACRQARRRMPPAQKVLGTVAALPNLVSLQSWGYSYSDSAFIGYPGGLLPRLSFATVHRKQPGCSRLVPDHI